MTALLVALGAAVGAPLRFWFGSTYDRPGRPGGTLAVNLTGSLLLGAFTGLGLHGHAIALLGTGLCGGLTTYSSFAVQTVGLGPVRGSVYAVVTIVGAIALCAVGFVVGTALA